MAYGSALIYHVLSSIHHAYSIIIYWDSSTFEFQVETDGSQQAINSLTFGRVSQNTNDDGSVQFMGFENGKTFGKVWLLVVDLILPVKIFAFVMRNIRNFDNFFKGKVV